MPADWRLPGCEFHSGNYAILFGFGGIALGFPTTSGNFEEQPGQRCAHRVGKPPRSQHHGAGMKLAVTR
jgi:hypothetical protein